MNNTVKNSFDRQTARIYNWMNLFALIAMVAINILANALPLGGNTSGQVSDRYGSLFTPAGITFSIWGLIYTLLGIVVIRQLISKNDRSSTLTKNIGGLFATSCALNIGWILCWHFGQITGATLIILVLLVNLIILLSLIGDDRLMSIAFGIYTAWIAVASVASIFVQASYLGADMISATGETYAMLAIVASGAILTATAIVTGNWSFTAVGIWAFAGIIIRMVQNYGRTYILVSGAALLMIVVMITGTAYMISARYYQGRTPRNKPAEISQKPETIPEQPDIILPQPGVSPL